MVRVRQAQPADLRRMMEIARHAVTAAQWNAAQYQEIFSSGRLTLVIEENGEVAGFVVSHAVNHDWEIENIAVIGTARRRRLGTHLLGEFLHHVRSSGGRQVFLEVRESNRSAR